MDKSGNLLPYKIQSPGLSDGPCTEEVLLGLRTCKETSDK